MKKTMVAKRVLLIILISVLILSFTGCAKKSIYPHDGVVYSSQFYADGAVYFKWLYNDFAFAWPLACAYIDDPGNAYQACYDPLCKHYDNTCPAISYGIGYTSVVLPEGREEPIVFTFGQHGRFENVNSGGSAYDSGGGAGVVRVYDVMTGEGHIITECDFYTVEGAWYLDGNIYLSADYLGNIRVGMLNVETGEYNEIDEGTPASVIGIFDGRLYYITSRGMVKSSDLTLSDIRDEYDCGGATPMRRAFVDGGMLYYAVNDHSPESKPFNSISVCDVYAVDLNDKGAGAKLVAENVCQFKPYNGDLYYTLWDYEELGTIELNGSTANVFSYDGGTLMRYDAHTEKSETCFTDCGTSFYKLYDIADGKLIFYGHQYRNPEECKNTATDNYMCVCDIETGEWSVVYHTTVAEGALYIPLQY